MHALSNIEEAGIVETSKNKDWHAWINLMPPLPNDFHVVGDVMVPNPGVDAILTPKEPQGINPTILLLELILVQKPGFWPQVITWKEARYDKIVVGNPYKLVQVFSDDIPIVELPVEEVC